MVNEGVTLTGSDTLFQMFHLLIDIIWKNITLYRFESLELLISAVFVCLFVFHGLRNGNILIVVWNCGVGARGVHFILSFISFRTAEKHSSSITVCVTIFFRKISFWIWFSFKLAVKRQYVWHVELQSKCNANSHGEYLAECLKESLRMT